MFLVLCPHPHGPLLILPAAAGTVLLYICFLLIRGIIKTHSSIQKLRVKRPWVFSFSKPLILYNNVTLHLLHKKHPISAFDNEWIDFGRQKGSRGSSRFLCQNENMSLMLFVIAPCCIRHLQRTTWGDLVDNNSHLKINLKISKLVWVRFYSFQIFSKFVG